MTGQLITFPVRLYARGARLLIHAAEDATGLALTNTLRIVGALSNLRPGTGDASAPAPSVPPSPQARRPDAPAARRPRPSNGNGNGNGGAPPTPVEPLASERLAREGVVEPVDLDTPTPIAPDHVSSEPVVVREEAEPGAQDGAGASITVQEPWEGYRTMNARELVARVDTLSSAELAAVQLYESTHRNRQTVISAVARALAKPAD